MRLKYLGINEDININSTETAPIIYERGFNGRKIKFV